ncbi:prepilin-type N-terminal cleavage/methylation domain-containing protein [Psychromonas aquimarina]|uniref:prepilin-type N-terminal cleavage/methylation domain-containing protein n=1 Tax=Psychromonas aquimarina TaxID=444919 RepID=UPI0003F90D21|nr:prepilin-type N-terminal cleavage/methylation domain-containing protein [Psychromonas aquimarina]
MKKQSGFTLIELVIVIIILGILAATAVPKFVDLQGDAREAAMKGMKGALEGAATLVYSQSAIAGQEKSPATTSTSTSGLNIVYGYPKATSADLSLVMELDSADWTITGTGPAYITAAGATSGASSTCKVTYTDATSVARPTIEVDNTTC